MSDLMKRLNNYPDISFINNTSYQELQNQMISSYERKLKEITGVDRKLSMADPYRMILYSCAVAIYQGYQYDDRAAKMGLLKYSTGNYLDNLAAFKGVVRNNASFAKTKLRFTLSTILNKAAAIPAGTRVKGADLYFETTEKGTIQPGEESVDVEAQCQESGTNGNGYAPGSIKTLVDLLPYTLKVENITESSGGADRETDDELAERIYLAPSKYSTAGTKGAYEYWVKSFEEKPSEVEITSEAPGEVDIYVMSPDGEIPDDGYIQRLENYIRRGTIRPLTDNVIVKKPGVVLYDITFSFYISENNEDIEKTIRKKVQDVCKNYEKSQRKIGKDIDPSEIIGLLYSVGAEKITLTSPQYITVENSQIAILYKTEIEYKGIKGRENGEGRA